MIGIASEFRKSESMGKLTMSYDDDVHTVAHAMFLFIITQHIKNKRQISQIISFIIIVYNE